MKRERSATVMPAALGALGLTLGLVIGCGEPPAPELPLDAAAPAPRQVEPRHDDAQWDAPREPAAPQAPPAPPPEPVAPPPAPGEETPGEATPLPPLGTP